jgi:hypothetical protein
VVVTAARWRAGRLAELTAHNAAMRLLVAGWRPPGGFGSRTPPEASPGIPNADAAMLRREARRLAALADMLAERAEALQG